MGSTSVVTSDRTWSFHTSATIHDSRKYIVYPLERQPQRRSIRELHSKYTLQDPCAPLIFDTSKTFRYRVSDVQTHRCWLVLPNVHVRFLSPSTTCGDGIHTAQDMMTSVHLYAIVFCHRTSPVIHPPISYSTHLQFHP